VEARRDHFALALRASRSEPPGRAAREAKRHAIYGSALQQFDELLSASRVVGPASQPLLLFYALSQGGRALVAARGDEAHVSSHGLTEDRTAPAESVLHGRIKRSPANSGSDTFGAVTRATGSPDFTGSIELGAVWAAIPSVHRLPVDAWREDWRLAIDVNTELARQEPEGIDLLLISLSGNPLVDGLSVFEGGRYPTLPADAKGALRARSGELGPGNWFADINLPGRAREDAGVLDSIAPTVYGGRDRALIPAFPGQSQVLSPLMLWWLLLFGLSIFARYHPAPWAAALDVQRSKEAVPLEAILSRAAELLPALIYEALFMNPTANEAT
jgi:hypothetical protein